MLNNCQSILLSLEKVTKHWKRTSSSATVNFVLINILETKKKVYMEPENLYDILYPLVICLLPKDFPTAVEWNSVSDLSDPFLCFMWENDYCSQVSF